MSEDPTRALPMPGTPGQGGPRLRPRRPRRSARRSGHPSGACGPPTSTAPPPTPGSRRAGRARAARRCRPAPTTSPASPSRSSGAAASGGLVDRADPLRDRADLPAGVHPAEPRPRCRSRSCGLGGIAAGRRGAPAGRDRRAAAGGDPRRRAHACSCAAPRGGPRAAVMLRVAGRPLPIVGRARVYVCGITPYDTTHLGHAATFVWADVAARVLRHLGVDVEVCRNVTDVDDVLDAAAARSGSRADSFAAVQQFRFDRDMAALGVRRPTHEPRARSHVGQVVTLAAALVALGAAYERDGTVWFRGAGLAERAGLTAADGGRAGRRVRPASRPRAEHPPTSPVWRRARRGRGGVAEPVGRGAARLARRVRGDGADDARACARPARRRRGPALPAPHLRGGDGRGGHRGGAVRAGLAARRHRRARRREDGQAHRQPGARVRRRWPSTPPRRCGCCSSTGRGRRPWEYDPDALDAATARLERLYARRRPGCARHGHGRGRASVTAALLDDLDVPRALAVAEEAGGEAARVALSVLGLS